MEKTLSIIKPNAVADNNIGNIIAMFEREGLRIAALKSAHLCEDTIKTFYAEHTTKPFFQGLVDFISSGPVILLVLEGVNAVEINRNLMGATDPHSAAEGTIRKLYANEMSANAVHGSDSLTSAQREIALFFAASDILERF